MKDLLLTILALIPLQLSFGQGLTSISEAEALCVDVSKIYLKTNNFSRDTLIDNCRCVGGSLENGLPSSASPWLKTGVGSPIATLVQCARENILKSYFAVYMQDNLELYRKEHIPPNTLEKLASCQSNSAYLIFLSSAQGRLKKELSRDASKKLFDICTEQIISAPRK
jgi:hypothetical protein